MILARVSARCWVSLFGCADVCAEMVEMEFGVVILESSVIELLELSGANVRGGTDFPREAMMLVRGSSV